MRPSTPPHPSTQAGASTYVTGMLDVGTAVQQQPHNVRVAADGCKHQRRPVLLASGAPQHDASVHTPPQQPSTYVLAKLDVGAVVQ